MCHYFIGYKYKYDVQYTSDLYTFIGSARFILLSKLQLYYIFFMKDLTTRGRAHSGVSALQQIQQKSSPLYAFFPGAKDSPQKTPTPLFESKTCKDLMTGNFDRVRVGEEPHLLSLLRAVT